MEVTLSLSMTIVTTMELSVVDALLALVMTIKEVKVRRK